MLGIAVSRSRNANRHVTSVVIAADTESGPDWEHFCHGADMGVRGLGATAEEAFEYAALALSATVCDPAEVRPLHSVEITCDAPDRELLLVDWLNAVIYEMATRRMLFSCFDVHLDCSKLSATVRGEAIDRERHRPVVEAKGATYTELRVGQQENGQWVAQCVIDV